MSERHKATLQQANAAITRSDIEGFLDHCTEDLEWTMVGDRTLHGKEAVRQWMAVAYAEPPEFTVTDLFAEGDLLAAVGQITVKNEDGKPVHSRYCDVWRFRDGKLAELRAYVVESGGSEV